MEPYKFYDLHAPIRHATVYVRNRGLAMNLAIIFLCAMCGVICSGMTLAYAASNDKRSKRLAMVWLGRTLAFATVGLLLVYVGVQ